MLPFKKPPIALPASAIQMFDDIPTMIIDSIVPAQPASSTGFRPTLSLREPHHMPVMDSAKAKAEMRRPA